MTLRCPTRQSHAWIKDESTQEREKQQVKGKQRDRIAARGWPRNASGESRARHDSTDRQVLITRVSVSASCQTIEGKDVLVVSDHNLLILQPSLSTSRDCRHRGRTIGTFTVPSSARHLHLDHCRADLLSLPRHTSPWLRDYGHLGKNQPLLNSALHAFNSATCHA